MEYVSVVSYKGARAYYRIFCEQGNIYKASLELYQGQEDKSPPKHLVFIRRGDTFIGDSDNMDLVRDLSENIDLMNTPLDEVLNKKKRKKPE